MLCECRIREVFINSIKRKPSGRSIIITADLIEEPKHVIWYFTLKAANECISNSMNTFRMYQRIRVNVTWFRLNFNGSL